MMRGEVIPGMTSPSLGPQSPQLRCERGGPSSSALGIPSGTEPSVCMWPLLPGECPRVLTVLRAIFLTRAATLTQASISRSC